MSTSNAGAGVCRAWSAPSPDQANAIWHGAAHAALAGNVTIRLGVLLPGIDDTLDVETQPLDWPQTLTKREQEIVQLVGQGLSNKDIAHALSISDSTVRHHMTNIFDKAGVPTRQMLMVHTHRLYSVRPNAHAYHPTIG